MSDRPTADAAYEEQARLMFPLDVTPEEYAARHAHEWGSFSFDDYRFSDDRLDAWIQRLGDIFFRRNGAPSVAELRSRFLTDEELAVIARREREAFKAGAWLNRQSSEKLDDESRCRTEFPVRSNFEDQLA